MISSFKINRFRAINECKIEGLSKINIFMGRNNSGKSSILEALYLASATFSFPDPLNRGDSKLLYLLNRRCERNLGWLRDSREILWHEYDRSRPITVEIKPKGHRKFKIELLDWHPHPSIKIPDISGVRRYFEANLPSRSLADSPYICLIETTIFNRKEASGLGSMMSKLLDEISSNFAYTKRFFERMMLVDTELIHNMEKIEKTLWRDLLKKRLDRLIINVLRKGYGVSVEDLTYMPYGNRFQLAVKLPETTRRADDLGDGARYSMVLLMVAALAKNTAILIEEPENHQHPGGLAKSLEMLLDLIKKNNVQLFVSTHSIEFSRIIEQIAKERKIGVVTFFIERDKKGNIEARRIEPKDADNLRKMGLDPRFLDIL